MNSDGTAYILQWEQEPLPDFMEPVGIEKLKVDSPLSPYIWTHFLCLEGEKIKFRKDTLRMPFSNLEKLQRRSWEALK